MARTTTDSGKQRSRGAAILGGIVVSVTAVCIAAVLGLLFLRKDADPGIRVWLLNHQPDQAIIVNPFKGLVEQKFLVADGLRELAFSRDFKHAYVASVVDVSNRIKQIDTRSYLQEDNIDVDGIPQGIGVFPDDKKLAVILGSKTDFQAGGFDVIDLTQRSMVDPHRRKRLYRERELALSHKLHVGDDGDRIYVIDAKKPLVNIYSLKAKKQVGAIDLHGSPEDMIYPRQGDFYYVSVLQHEAIYQFDKKTDSVVAAYLTEVQHAEEFHLKKIRFLCVDKDGKYLFGTASQAKSVFVWEIGNPDHKLNWSKQVTNFASSDAMVAENPSTQLTLEAYLPTTAFKMQGGYDPTLKYLPEPERIAVDNLDQNLFVVDGDGALFLFDFKQAIEAEPDSTQKPYKIVPGTKGEMRDMKISQPAGGVVKAKTSGKTSSEISSGGFWDRLLASSFELLGRPEPALHANRDNSENLKVGSLEREARRTGQQPARGIEGGGQEK